MSRTRCVELQSGILDGTMLAIDPTSGSRQFGGTAPSVAGWALFEEAALIASGTIEIPFFPRKEDRFRALLDILHTSFDGDYDVLALEDIPLARRRGNFSTSQTLIQVCGVYAAGLSGELVEMNTGTWQAIARRVGGWIKGDEADAQYIGLAAIALAAGYNQTFAERRKVEFVAELIDEYDGWGLPLLLEHWRISE